MTTVLTLPGLGGPSWWPNRFFNRALTTVGNPVPECLDTDFDPISEVVNLQYNQLWPITAAREIKEGLSVLPSDEPAIVMGHSEGALGIVLFHRYYAPQSCRDPSWTLFVTSGAGWQIKDPTPSVRQSRFRTRDVTKGFDEIADKPNVPASSFFQQAWDNAQALKIHTVGYQGLDLSGPHRKSVNGQVTYLFYDTTQVAVPGVTIDDIKTAYDRRIWLGAE